MVKAQYPILEFDANPNALINPANSHSRIEIAEHCVPCFFSDVIDKLVSDGRARMLIEMVAESGVTPVYEVDFRGRKVALFNPGLGGPSAAKNLEKVIALGCSKFIACGGAEVLNSNSIETKGRRSVLFRSIWWARFGRYLGRRFIRVKAFLLIPH